MQVDWLRKKGSWREVADSARTTIHKEAGINEPSDGWKKQILLAEHSPIRTMQFKWKWLDLPYFVSVHFARHWLGIVHFVSTSRTDRTGVDRTKLYQDNPVDHECEANAQALINISRKRLCRKASKETQDAWWEVRRKVQEVDTIMAEAMVCECVYRGFCPEFSSCGFCNTPTYQEWLAEYRNIPKKEK